MNTQKSMAKQDRMLPPKVSAVLSIRDSGGNECPTDIINRIEALKIGKMVYHFKGAQQPVSPNTNSWRTKNRDTGFRSSNHNSNHNPSHSSNHNSNTNPRR